MPARSGDGLGNEIASDRATVADVEIREFGRVKPEPLVMHRREHDIAHAGIHRHATEPVGVEILRGEPGGELLVFLQRDFLAVPDPLAPFQQRVEAVVDEEPVAGFQSVEAVIFIKSARANSAMFLANGVDLQIPDTLPA
jgi:hypothetical protein